MRCAPLCGCNAGYPTAIPGGKEFNVIFRHNLQERKTRRSVRVCAEYRPPGSTLGYRLSTPEHKGRFTLKLNRSSTRGDAAPSISPKHAGCPAGHYTGITPGIEGGAYPGITPGTPLSKPHENASIIMRGSCGTVAVFRRFSANLRQRGSSHSAPLKLLSLSTPPSDDGCFPAKEQR